MAKYKVYRAINVTKQEVYHGVAKDVEARKDGSHCVGGTIALQHWVCSKHKIIWKVISTHTSQKIASAKSHNLEHTYKHHKGFKNLKTSGI